MSTQSPWGSDYWARLPLQNLPAGTLQGPVATDFVACEDNGRPRANFARCLSLSACVSPLVADDALPSSVGSAMILGSLGRGSGLIEGGASGKDGADSDP
jgi:hypothetical protein